LINLMVDWEASNATLGGSVSVVWDQILDAGVRQD